MNFHIQHETLYRYEESVAFTPHRVFLYPRHAFGLEVLNYQLQTRPHGAVRWVRDCFENAHALVTFSPDTQRQLTIRVTFDVSLSELDPFHFLLETHALEYPFAYRGHERQALQPYLQDRTPADSTTVLQWFYRYMRQSPRDTVEFLSELNQAVYSNFNYTRRDEQNIQTPDETIALGSGSCRDLAVLFIALVRQLGMAGRFVSGYLYDPPAGQVESGMGSFNRALGSMHAWVEVYLPGAGWKGYDPTNGILANHFFIPTGVAHDPALVNPIQGSYLHASHVHSEMSIDLHITHPGDNHA